MSLLDEEALAGLLRSALPPVGEPGLGPDLWPEMWRRLARPPQRPSVWEWGLMAAASLWLLAFPQGIAGLLYLL